MTELFWLWSLLAVVTFLVFALLEAE